MLWHILGHQRHKVLFIPQGSGVVPCPLGALSDSLSLDVSRSLGALSGSLSVKLVSSALWSQGVVLDWRGAKCTPFFCSLSSFLVPHILSCPGSWYMFHRFPCCILRIGHILFFIWLKVNVILKLAFVKCYAELPGTTRSCSVS